MRIVKTSQVYEPLIAPKDIQAKSYGTIAAGKVNGLKAVVRTLAEGKDGNQVEIETHQIGQAYYDDLEDYCRW